MIWILCTGVLLLGCATAVLLPLLGPARPWVVADLRGARRLLLQEKERLLRLVKDLDAELEREAIDAAEHERLRRGYMLEAAQVQRKIDQEPKDDSVPQPLAAAADSAGAKEER